MFVDFFSYTFTIFGGNFWFWLISAIKIDESFRFEINNT